MTFDRRTFLRGGMALGFGVGVWGRGGQPMAQSLAASTSQRLALLIGVGSVGGGLGKLKGCGSDVERLAEVLQYRYGFLASDIVTLTQPQGSLAQIREAFESHLQQRARKGDGVVVYFSGYGTYAPPPNISPPPTWEQAIPYLGLLPADALTNDNRPQSLGLAALIGWLQSLKTKQVTLILDCGFAQTDATLQGNLHSRSAGRLDASPAAATSNGQTPPKFALAPVNLISAAAPGQTAVEGQMATTTTGLFTYGLTQSLWEAASANLMAGLWDHSRLLLVPRLGSLQTPQWQSASNSPDFLSPLPSCAAGEGGILAGAASPSIQSHLAGLTPLVQRKALFNSCYQATAIATEVPFTPPPLWQVSSIKGQRISLVPLSSNSADKEAEKDTEIPFSEAIAQGSLREIYRAIPKSLALTVALGSDLERIERVDATSAFGAISQRSATRYATVEAIINAGEGRADCVFGKLDTHRYTLFSEGGELLQPLTKSESSGAIKTVVSTLESSLNRLLALKWLTLLANADSTRLGVQMNLTQQTSGENPLPRSLYEWRSPRFPKPNNPASSDHAPSVPSAPPDFLPTVAANQTLQCQLENLGNETLYGCLLGIDNRNLGVAGIFDPQLQLLKPLQRLTLPRPDDPLWSVTGEKGIAQWFLVLSRYPLQSTLTALSQQVTSNNSAPSATPTLPSRLLVLKNLLPVVLALVEDLSSHPPDEVTVADDVTLLDTADWLNLPIMYQVL